MAKIIFNGRITSLPAKFNYTPDDDASAVYMLTGTVYGSSDSKIIGMKLMLGDEEIMTASIFSNGRWVHRGVTGIGEYKIPLEIPVTAEGVPKIDKDGSLQPKELEFTIDVLNSDTVFDKYDHVNLVKL